MLSDSQLDILRHQGDVGEMAALEIESLRCELDIAKTTSLAVVKRLQARIETLESQLEASSRAEQAAMHYANELYNTNERAGDAYAAASSGY